MTRSRCGGLPDGSAAWCVLVTLGLYGAEAPGGALARTDIERCVDRLRPQLARCDSLRWSVATRLQRRGLVEEVGDRGESYRLTERGCAVAEGLVRRLEVPLTALSPLQVAVPPAMGVSPCDTTLPHTEYPKSVDDQKPALQATSQDDVSDDDDRPLSLLASRAGVSVAAVPSPQRRRLPAIVSLGDSLGVVSAGIVAIPAPSSRCDVDSTLCGNMPLPSESGPSQSSSRSDLAPPDLTTFAFQPVIEPCLQDSAILHPQAPQSPSIPPPLRLPGGGGGRSGSQRPRRLRVSQSAPPFPLTAVVEVEAESPPSTLATKRRLLAPASSEPVMPTALSAEPSSPSVRGEAATTAASCAQWVPKALSSSARCAAGTTTVSLAQSREEYEGTGRRQRLVLLLDHREVGAGREHAARGAFFRDLAGRLGADAVEARALPLGDVLWVWREELPRSDNAGDVGDAKEQTEYVAGWIIERKTFHDLSASIVDGRYDEQKIRLLEAPGVEGVVYLIEGAGPLFGVAEPARGQGVPKADSHVANRGFGQRLLHRTLPQTTLSTTAAHTQLISGFHVVHTTSTSHTVSLLVALHDALETHGHRRPHAVDGIGVGVVSYLEFAERTRKSCHARVFEAFGRMLRVIPHCGPEATEAIVDEFPTPQAFAVALRDCSDTDLLLRLKARRGGRAPVSAATLAACRELFVG